MVDNIALKPGTAELGLRLISRRVGSSSEAEFSNTIAHFCASQTPLKHHVDIWCTWTFRDIDQLGDSIDINFDISCCQGLLLTEERERLEESFFIEVSEHFLLPAAKSVALGIGSIRRVRLANKEGSNSCCDSKWSRRNSRNDSGFDWENCRASRWIRRARITSELNY